MIVEEKKAVEHICPHLTEWRQKCEGSRCMAWRWDVEDKLVPGGVFIRQRSTTHGYCGLAGRP